MIVTKEQQEAILNKYIKEKHNTDECSGFVDGINAALELVNKLTIPVVSQQRELLKAFLQYVNCSDTDSKVSFDLLDKYLNSL